MAKKRQKVSKHRRGGKVISSYKRKKRKAAKGPLKRRVIKAEITYHTNSNGEIVGKRTWKRI